MDDATNIGPVKKKSHHGDTAAALFIIYISSLVSLFLFLNGSGSSANGIVGGIVLILGFLVWSFVFLVLAITALVTNKRILFDKTILIACVVNVVSSVFVVGEYSNDGSGGLDSYYEEAGKTFLWKKYPNGTELPGASFLGSFSFFLQLAFFVLMIILIGVSLGMKGKADFNKDVITS